MKLKVFILLIISLSFVSCSSDKRAEENRKDDAGTPAGKKEDSNGSPQTPPLDEKNPDVKTTPEGFIVCEGKPSRPSLKFCTPKDLSWLRKAETESAYVKIVDDQVIWERGVWKNGEWYGDVWINGVWENGVWHGGTWKDGAWKSGYWRDGWWNNGNWEGGTWAAGVWDTGLWKGGYWRGGVWQDGIWKTGVWQRGTWNGGVWESGDWWIHGIWNGGIWKKGDIYQWNPDRNSWYLWYTSYRPPSEI